jgi:hypothetical protein
MNQRPDNARAQATRGVCAHFFGQSVDDADPLSVLGITGPPRDQAQIIAALNARLGILASHPESVSPHGDEARFRLHAAAAKVMVPSSAPGGWVRDSAPGEFDSALQGALLRTVAMHGGWNRDAFRMSLLIARSMGAGPEQLVGALESLRHSPWEVESPASPSAPIVRQRPSTERGAIGRAPNRSEPASHPSVLEPPEDDGANEELDPSRRLIVAGAWIIGGVLALIVAATAVLVVLTRTGDGTGGPSTPNQAGAPTEPTGAGPGVIDTPRPLYTPPPRQAARPARDTAEQGAVPEWEDRLRDLETAISLLRTGQPEAVYAAGLAIDTMAAEWARASQDQRRAGVNLCIESVYASSGGTQAMLIGQMLAPAEKAINAAVPTPAQLTSGVWAAGLLARLSSDRDLPYASMQELRRAAARVFAESGPPAENSFDAGSAAMLLALSRTLTRVSRGPEPDQKAYEGAWRAWIEALHAVRGRGSELHVRTTLAALDALLTTGPEPTQSRAVYEAVGALVQSIDWRDGDESQRWLIRVFDDRAYSTADIHALTATLAGKSAAAGVDPTMVLHLGAHGDDRAMLRDAYASAWGLSTAVTRDAGLQRWREIIISERSGGLIEPGHFPSGSPVDTLLAAHRLARINAAAMAMWRGQSDVAGDLLVDPDGGLSARIASIASLMASRHLDNAPAGVSAWGVSYLQAGTRIPDRARLLGQHTDPLTWADAQIIAWEAFYAPQDAISAPARLLLRRYAGSPQMLSAVLDLAPVLPQTHTSNELISAIAAAPLPHIRDSKWRVAVRRDLVARFIETIADTGSLRAVEEITRALGEAYEQQASQAQSKAAPGSTMQPNPEPTEQAAKLLARWEQESQAVIPSGREPFSLQTMHASRAARSRVSTGDVQEFVAMQAAIAERMAFVFVAARPAMGDGVSLVVQEMRQEMRSTEHVFGQILACERAICRLWVLQLGEGAAQGDGA